MTKPGKQERNRTGAVVLVAIAVAVAASVLAVFTVVMPALRDQRAIRETPNYGYDPYGGLRVVTETEAARAATVREAEASLEAAEAALREARQRAGMGDHFPNHVHGELQPKWPARESVPQEAARRRATGTDDDPLVGLDGL